MSNLNLRKLEAKDFPLFYAWWNDEELRKLTSDKYEPIADQEVDEILAKHLSNGNYFDYIVELDGKPIGHILIEKTGDRRATFYIALGEKEVWGQGYGTEAIEKSIHDYLLLYPETTFELEVNQDNPRAIGAYLKAGFKKVGENSELNQKPTFIMTR
jgi:RimJ/RimL family protein N-acetyltransferase